MRKAIAIDFDGCLCENKWPDIGEPNWAVINRAKAEQRAGAGLILWTCRVGERLTEAVQFCKSCGLEFDAVNDNLPERTAAYGANPRKVNADEYWDDRAVRLSAVGPMPDTPLTLDELREMDGEPVYVILEEDDAGPIHGYGIVGNDLECVSGFGFMLLFEDYGAWLAYRHKPEEVEDVCSD